jgi:hypothetical protein
MSLHYKGATHKQSKELPMPNEEPANQEGPLGPGAWTTGVSDGCHFPGSLVPKATNGNWLGGGEWTVGTDNILTQFDEIGVENSVGPLKREWDEYYADENSTPCQIIGTQHMRMHCSWDGFEEHTIHGVMMDAQNSGTAITRDGETTPTRN